jgi:cbb3-type cytochrome oxidase maturation protein
MNTLIYLIPIALLLGGLGLAAFLWSLKIGQYDDVEGAAWRVLDDGDDRPQPAESAHSKSGRGPNNPLS